MCLHLLENLAAREVIRRLVDLEHDLLGTPRLVGLLGGPPEKEDGPVGLRDAEDGGDGLLVREGNHVALDG